MHPPAPPPCLQYLTIPSISYNCNKYCDPIGHSGAQDCDKRSEIVDLQLINQIPDLLASYTLQYLTIPIIYLHYLRVLTNTVIQLHGHSEAWDCDKWSEIVDLQPWPPIRFLTYVLHPTIPYNTYSLYLHYLRVLLNKNNSPYQPKWSIKL